MSVENLTSDDMLNASSTEATGHAQVCVFSDALTNQLFWAVQYLVKPSLGMVGLVGNMISIIVICGQGLSKCSNILLVALAVADLSVSLANINFSYVLDFAEAPPSFTFSREVNECLVIVNLILLCLKSTGEQCSLVLPLIIILERILAIFFPFHFHLIVKPTRTWATVAGLFSVFTAVNIYSLVYVQLVQRLVDGAVMGQALPTGQYLSDIRSGSANILSEVVNYVSETIPVTFVSIGCFITAVYLKVLSSRYSKLTARRVDSRIKPHIGLSKTTKTQLSVCLLYILCSGTAYVCGLVSKYFHSDTNFKNVMNSVSEMLTCINCSSNFIIYVAMNKHFRDVYSLLLRGKLLKNRIYQSPCLSSEVCD